jgi:tetratricopeptide (TPR) repeat protein
MSKCYVPLLVLLLSACVNMPLKQNVAEVDLLVANQQYGRALDILARVDPKAPDYSEMAEQRRQIEALAASYEQAIRAQTRQYVEKGNWNAALDLYDDALARLPQSMVLRDGLAQLHQQQNQELERLDTERLLAHGNWLKDTLPTYRQIAQVNPRSRAASQQLERIQQQAVEMANQLTQLGNRALANDDMDTASQTLLLAHQLSDAPAISESVTKLQQRLEARNAEQQQQQSKRQQQAQAVERTRQREIIQHQSKYMAARSDNDYLAAREQLRHLRRLDPNNPEWKQEQENLDVTITARTEQLFKEGINAYGRGEYEKAAESWRATLDLDPDHKLAKDNLERAERVLDRIQKLQQR